jgi:hypothetical protein
MTMPTTPQDSFSQQSVDRRDRSFGGRSERLQVLSSNVPPNSGIAFVLVQHLSPDHNTRSAGDDPEPSADSDLVEYLPSPD